MQFSSVRAALGWYLGGGGPRHENVGAVLAACAISAALEALGPDRPRVLRHVLRGCRLAPNDRRTRRALRALAARLHEEGLVIDTYLS